MALTDMTFRRAPSAPHLTFDLPADGASVAKARYRVRAHLEDQDCCDDTCETALLLLSELFTNALLHTASTTIGCVVRPDGRLLRIEVRDEGGGADLAPGPQGTEEVHGRGLLMVETLSAAWGVSVDGRGQTVWCSLRNEAR